MNMNMRKINANVLPGFLIWALLIAGCTLVAPDAQPAAGGDEGTGTDAAAISLMWEGAPLGDETQCGQLSLDADGQATFGPCAEADATQSLGETHMHVWTDLQAQLASFEAETANGMLTLHGTGDATGDAWQRAAAAWARLLYSEFSSGGVSATGPTAMSWHLGETADADLCQHLTVLSYGYVYAQTIPCAGGPAQESVGGWLTGDELETFDNWLYGYAPVYAGDNYLNGVGTQEATEAETDQMDAWAQSVYARLGG